MYFVGRPTEINRFLGQCDQDDATNLPIGLAALCLNTDFTLTSARTRAGVNTTIQGLNPSPITGILGMAYSPESATENFFQRPLLFDLAGMLQAEYNVGSEQTKAVPIGLFTPPANAHMIGSQAYNKGYLAFSNLLTPSSPMAVYDLKTDILDPYGLKQMGGGWIAGKAYAVGEFVCPSTIVNGSTVAAPTGHIYRCMVPGVTGNVQPGWPVTTGGTIIDGGVTWAEDTPVLTNRLSPPVAVPVTEVPAGGTFPASRDVFLLMTYTNAQGETIAGALCTTGAASVLNDAFQITTPLVASLPAWMQGLATGVNVYEYDQAHGTTTNPPTSLFQKVGSYGFGALVTVTTSATSAIYPPATNTARITPFVPSAPTTAPQIAAGAGGTFAAGQDIYVAFTYADIFISVGLGIYEETTLGVANKIVNSAAATSITVQVPTLAQFPSIPHIGVYAAAVPTGTAAPLSSQYALVGYYPVGSGAETISGPPGGNPPPVTSTWTLGSSATIAPDVTGLRYMACLFVNRNGAVSGFTLGTVIGYNVDVAGYPLEAFNLPIGPPNTASRIFAFTVADGDPAGPYKYIPQAAISNGLSQTATRIYDNTTTTATFGFTDTFLAESTDVTFRLQTMEPYPCVDVAYLPSIDRVVQTGVPGYYSGHVFSRAADPESYQSDSAALPIGSDDGQRAWGVREFRGTIYSLRERSGFVINPITGTEPNGWNATERWSKVGPCGPRAFDVCGSFMIFVHRSGVYRYESDAPDLVSKENPKWWQQINWAAAQTIWCKIDEETHTVRMGFPTGNSTVPNKRVTISYLEGWNNPIHFSTYTSKEISMDAARKYSFDDVAAFLALRIERTIPNPPSFLADSPDLTHLDSSFYSSQMVYASSGADGTVQADTPGIYSDNGAGIDWQYETVCPAALMSVNKIEGFNLNARGFGTIFASFLGGRDMVTDVDATGAPVRSKELKARPFDLMPDQSTGISRMVPGKTNERWRMRFTNGKQPGAWCELKYACMFSTPMFSGRQENEN